MMHWIKDAVEAAKLIRQVRKGGEAGKLSICTEDTWEEQRKAALYMARSYTLAYDCIEDMAKGKSRCRWCLFRDGCKDPKRGNVRGCPGWALTLPEEENNEQAAAAENRETKQENHQAGVQGDDEGAADGCPGEERDHGGGPEERMA